MKYKFSEADREMEQIMSELKIQQVLRISCSDIAAVCGFNPWSKMDALFEKYLYQDLPELMELDAQNLDTEFITIEQQINGILDKLDEEDKRQLKLLDSDVLNSDLLNNNAKAEEFLSQVKLLMDNKKVVDKLNRDELKVIADEYRGRIRRNYGIHCEHKLLDRYEEHCGFPVTERNLQSIKMVVMPLENSGVKRSMISMSVDHRLHSSSTNVQIASSSSNSSSSISMRDAFSELLMASKRSSAECKLQAMNDKRKRRKGDCSRTPSFVLVGRVDGISHQLDTSSDDAALWRPIKVVVEMKSRVKRVAPTPPLYEQIQLVSYMTILDCSCGDLGDYLCLSRSVDAAYINKYTVYAFNTVQAVAEDPIKTDRAHPVVQEDAPSFQVTRITLDGPPYYHRRYWDAVILPRLRTFREAIYEMRSNDLLRYAYLQHTYDDKMRLLQSLIPFLELPDD